MCTDMSQHFKHLANFRTKANIPNIDLHAEEDRLMVLSTALKCAGKFYNSDIGHAAKQ